MNSKNLISSLEFTEYFLDDTENDEVVNEYIIRCAVQEKAFTNDDVEYCKATGGNVVKKKVTVCIFIEDLED